MSEFPILNLSNKINHLIDFSKQQLTKHHRLDNCFFLIDRNLTVYLIPIENDKFIDVQEYRKLFNKIASRVVKQIETEYDTVITNTLYIYVDVFDVTATNKVDLNAQWDEDLERKNSMIVINESKFNTNISVYGYIHWHLEDGEHSIISEEPIKKLNLSKLDSDNEIKGFLTNILK